MSFLEGVFVKKRSMTLYPSSRGSFVTLVIIFVLIACSISKHIFKRIYLSWVSSVATSAK